MQKLEAEPLLPVRCASEPWARVNERDLAGQLRNCQIADAREIVRR